ncbi:MAG TPA: TOMM precursor leader peptide-binding protein [Solirubrobacterales bacterium]|nr:TOMM precursor leader peptide-binding protein [Solirubrobacterales bacterium]
MRRPRIKRTTEEIETPEGDIYLLRPSAENDIRIEKPDAEERRLLAAVDGERTLEQLRDEFGAEEVDELIAQLQELEVVEDAADDERIDPVELERFDRQLRYFSDIGNAQTPTPSQCQERLREAKVAVLGVGGLGSWSALALACTGIGELWLIDGDRVEVSNLNRQVLYSEADVGLLKVECAASRLRAFNSGVKITTEARRLESADDIAEFIAGSDIVIDAADWPTHEIERWCNSASFEAGIPYITMSHFPPVARVGPLYVPGKTGCFTCQEIRYRREYPLYDVAVEQGRAKPSPAATLGPACGLIGGQVAMETMHLLTGLSRPAAQGVAHIYDLRTMEVKRDVVRPEPECPVCGGMPHEEVEEEDADG